MTSNNSLRLYTNTLSVQGDNPQLTHSYTGAFYLSNPDARTTNGTVSLERIDEVVPIRGMIAKLIPDWIYKATFAEHFRSSALEAKDVDLLSRGYEEPLLGQAAKDAWPISGEQVAQIFEPLRQRLKSDLQRPNTDWNLPPTI